MLLLEVLIPLLLIHRERTLVSKGNELGLLTVVSVPGLPILLGLTAFSLSLLPFLLLGIMGGIRVRFIFKTTSVVKVSGSLKGLLCVAEFLMNIS